MKEFSISQTGKKKEKYGSHVYSYPLPPILFIYVCVYVYICVSVYICVYVCICVYIFFP